MSPCREDDYECCAQCHLLIFLQNDSRKQQMQHSLSSSDVYETKAKDKNKCTSSSSSTFFSCIVEDDDESKGSSSFYTGLF
jgi:hypothetical protein